MSTYLRYKGKLERREAKRDSESSIVPVGEVDTSVNESTLSDLTGESSAILDRPKGAQSIGSTIKNKILESERVMDTKMRLPKSTR